MDIAEIRKKAKKKKKSANDGEGKELSLKEETSQEKQDDFEELGKQLKEDSSIPSSPEKKGNEEGPQVTETSEEEEKSLIEMAAETIFQSGVFGDRIIKIENLEEFLGIKINKEEYGLDIKKVVEIIKVPEITDVPLTPDYVLGVIYLRGKVTPLISLRKKLGYGEQEIDKNSRVIIVDNGEEQVGLLADEVTQVFRLPPKNIEPPPVSQKETEKLYVSAIGRYEGIFLRILNIEEISKIELPEFEGEK